MKIHNVKQGSDEWLKLREGYFTASESSAIFGESKYISRAALMNEKKGIARKVSDYLQKLFDEGHAAEEKARDLLEFEIAETFQPIVATLEVEGLQLLASLDGISEDGKTVFEHKLWNEVLAENVRNEVLEPAHYWQLEHQLLVSGAENVLFVVSDGTSAKREKMHYTSKPERRAKLIAGWHEFKKDLNGHEPTARREVIVAREQESFPLITCSVEGSMVVSNLSEYIPLIKKLADEQMSLVLDSDQDFADKEVFNKNVKVGRETLKAKASDIEKKFESLAEFNSYVKQADTILQKLQAHGEKQVKEAKEAKKLSIINKAQSELNKHLAELSETINNVQIPKMAVDFEAATKGKRNFENMEEAVRAELVHAKLAANETAGIIRKNLDSLTELTKDHKFLFSDYATLLQKNNDDLVNLIKARIAEHEKAEAERKQQEKERMEREAKEKAEREAQAKIDAEEKRIREEERAKVQAEAAAAKAKDDEAKEAEAKKIAAEQAEQMRKDAEAEEKVNAEVAEIEKAFSDMGMGQRPELVTFTIICPEIKAATVSAMLIDHGASADDEANIYKDGCVYVFH